MKVTGTELKIADFSGDVLVVGAYEDGLSPPADQLDTLIGGAITRLVESGDISGKPNEVTTILAPSGFATLRVFVIGLGKKEDLNIRRAYEAACSAAVALSSKKVEKAGFYLDDFWPSEVIEQAIAGAVVGCHGQDLYRKEKKQNPPGEIVWSSATQENLEKGISLGNSINLTRTLVNRCANDIYPATFAEEAAVVAENHDLNIEVWDKAKLTEENCGSLLAVARASVREPRLVILRYNGGKKGEPPIALVGKGVTFDSGGLSLKPSDSMITMKGDMAGAATVLGAIKAIAAWKLPVNVVALCGLVENMVSGDSYKLGDILTSRSGKTIEVLNTDAEGRLVLADVLNVALDEKPSAIVDLATLTGACVVALGTDTAGLMTNEPDWCYEVQQASLATGEKMWELPMYPEFGDQVKSQIADVKNVGDGRWGGAITAAKFLEEFVDETPWTHIDIAGPSFAEKPKPYCSGGATGFAVRTLLELVRRQTA
ncbi:leucyl aminopeptidase [Bremerella cremea]|uniref:Probable cytosol aminopeptidase n=1 Tax=Blastopirellula marina TaxID=124 RepID=A0A2S8FBU3_9BACT|nr:MULTISPECIES: leucyl aminopeptidase [Pirellulaceae]PQO29633.1 leucyl aminopeptidase [Blastopirellula marina]RCS42935.1 leucyl aminopeptidase [Bremerella cremea]